MYIDPVDNKAWGEELRSYHNSRKQLVEFQKPRIFTQKEMKMKECEFNPLLQTYQNPEKDTITKQMDFSRTQQNVQKQLEQRKKYLHEYDLVNLESVPGIERPDEREKIKTNLLPPNFNDYNIITNEKIGEEYYKNMKVIKPLKNTEKPIINRNKRDYNIITNKFLKDHDEKFLKEVNDIDAKTLENSKKQRNFNPVVGEYFDNQRENEFQSKLKNDQLNHGKTFNERFPPSWKFRESVYLDQTKEVPQEIRMIDEIKKNNKKRYQVRHVLEQEYRERDIHDQLRAEDRLLHRSKYDDLIKKYDKGIDKFFIQQKEFDIITLQKPEIDHILKALPPKPPQNSWDKVQMTKQQSFQGDVPLKEISIPDGVEFQHNVPSRLPNISRGSKGSKAASEKSYQRAPSGPKSESQSQKSQPQQVIQSGGFFIK